MERKEIEQKVLAIVADHQGYEPDEVNITDRLDFNLECDSLDLIEIIMDCEREFGIYVPDESIGGTDETVASLCDRIEKIIKEDEQ